MPLKVKEIEEEAFRLPFHDRAQLAECLIRSLDEEEDPEAERLWLEETERRYQEYKEGKVKTKPAELVFKEARSKLE
jgi:putative addiction module component (TIGR02574 family)